MLIGKSILVTSGGTQELIDDVRVITNTSTGKTGAAIAEELTRAGAVVHYVHGLNAALPVVDTLRHPVMSANDALCVMNFLVSKFKIDAVVHCMAVSDFTFNRNKPVKCKSNDLNGFIEYMRETITPNPKIIGEIKKWDPNVILVGFKYEVGLPPEELRGLAEASIEKNGCDLVITNDKVVIEQSGSHIASFVYSKRMKEAYGFSEDIARDNADLAEKLTSFLETVLNSTAA